MEQFLNQIAEDLFMVKTKLSMPDGVAQIRNARFWLPNFPADVIQRLMFFSNDYWDRQGLDIIDKYLVDDAVIVDVGANLGSHSLFWAIERHAKKIYAFEPLTYIYDCLERNIELNNMEDVIIPYPYGLWDKECNAEIIGFDFGNIGATAFLPCDNGLYYLKDLDSINIPEKIDLIKIDAKDAEVEILFGAMETIKRDKPVIVLESYNRRYEVERLLENVNYSLAEVIRENEDYIYKSNDLM